MLEDILRGLENCQTILAFKDENLSKEFFNLTNSNKKSCLDILNVGEAFPPNNVYKVNVSYNHIEDICYISMIMSHRYDIDTKAFVALSKKYNLDFNTVIIDWNECFAHKLRIEKGVIINDEEIEDDDAIYFEFF